MAASKTLGEAILVPRVYSELTTRYMLVTEWVEGVKVGKNQGKELGRGTRAAAILCFSFVRGLPQLFRSDLGIS